MQLENLEDSKLELKNLKNNVGILLIFGFVLTVIGFQRWYIKIQKPMDKKLMLELEIIKGQGKNE